jgi:type I restriction enzyme M protein
MPSNIFATTGTNVSILFLDATNREKVILIDASGLGEKVKDGKNQKTVLRAEEEDRIIATFNGKEAVEDFSVVVSYEEIEAKNYSFSAGQYFDVKMEYVEITAEEFSKQLSEFESRIAELFTDSANLEKEIRKQTAALRLNETLA